MHYRHDRTQTLVRDTCVCITDMIGHIYISAGYLCVHDRHDRTQILVRDTCVCITDMIGHGL